ncbi:SDR family oxidoreductase [Catenulispora subtropica]|uniref:SDR family oxidoreductase n=2 Tax=Catenulispora subtropica TaxID=450798 RepID=A0ABN2TCT6_9ACTN
MVTSATAVVTGASRGFGLAISTALVEAGTSVIGVARDAARLGEVAADLGASFLPVVADAADPALPRRLIAAHHPDLVVLNAGAVPEMRPLHQHTWESFGRVWETDVRQAFSWCGEALRMPLAAGSTVIAVSSMAALRGGSPLSGGYAGAKATMRFIASYAAEESDRAELGIRFLTLMPMLTSTTRLGQVGVAGYAERQGMTVEQFLKARGDEVQPEQVAEAVLTLRAGQTANGSAFTLMAQGLEQLG